MGFLVLFLFPFSQAARSVPVLPSGEYAKRENEMMKDAVRNERPRKGTSRRNAQGEASKIPPYKSPQITFPSGQSVKAFPNGNVWAAYRPPHPSLAAPVVRFNGSLPVSENYTMAAFAPSKPYPYIRIAPALVEALEAIAYRLGRPLTVLSGYRPNACELTQGCACVSHIDGIAADIQCDGVSLEQLHEACDAVIGERGGVGIYADSGFMHVDVRGFKERWGQLPIPAPLAAEETPLVRSESHECWHGPIRQLHYGQGRLAGCVPGRDRNNAIALRVGIIETLEGFSVHQFGRSLGGGSRALGWALPGFLVSLDQAKAEIPTLIAALARL